MKILNKIAMLTCMAAAVATAASCSSEEKLDSPVDLVDYYSVTDDPNDPVQHRRYEIYKEFNVPVFFNDTIAGRQVGTDIYGRPINRYETVDLNWSFDNYNSGIKYGYEYIESDDDKLGMLDVVEKYLQNCSRSMRPYSILAVKKFHMDPEPEGGVPDYYFVGFRTLVLHGSDRLLAATDVNSISKTIINNMVLDKVKANKTVVARFASVSDPSWYYQQWRNENGPCYCPTYTMWNNNGYLGYGATTNHLFYGEPYVKIANVNMDWLDYMEYLIGGFNDDFTREDGEQVIHEVVGEIGRFGFIRGWVYSGQYSPDNADEDLEYFVSAILGQGKELFTSRYGHCPLVMQKFQILYDFMIEELELEL